MNVAFDIDDTITAMPAFFALLSACIAKEVGRVIIVSSRSNTPSTVTATRRELDRYGIRYDHLYLLDGFERASTHCPHQDLDWHSRYLWQKIDICLCESIDLLFEDDARVISLAKRYAPGIKVMTFAC